MLHFQLAVYNSYKVLLHGISSCFYHLLCVLSSLSSWIESCREWDGEIDEDNISRMISTLIQSSVE